jgi:AcrR family transcriptional regulator
MPPVLNGTRESLIRSALVVFREKGYERTTVRAIADHAGVPISTLYTHIESKEKLFLELVSPVIERADARLEEIVGSERSPTEKLREAIVAAATAFDDNSPELFIYLADFYPVFARENPHGRRPYEQLWQDLLQSGIASGDFRADLDTKLVSYGVLGMVSWMHQWYRTDGRATAQQIGEQFAALIIGGLAVRPGEPTASGAAPPSPATKRRRAARPR